MGPLPAHSKVSQQIGGTLNRVDENGQMLLQSHHRVMYILFEDMTHQLGEFVKNRWKETFRFDCIQRAKCFCWRKNEMPLKIIARNAPVIEKLSFE
mgnify:CR=1 FL=1